MEKVAKLNLRITANPHANLHALTKTPAEFQKDPAKIVGGAAVTRVDIFLMDSQTDKHTDVMMGGDIIKNIYISTGSL